jgi:RNA-directed DNA polymerase
LLRALADRLAACKLVLHPEKTKIVHCKDVNRRGDHPNQTFDFLGPDDPGMALHHRSDKSLQDLAAIYNPYIQGWINYYGQFYRKQLRPTLQCIDTYCLPCSASLAMRFGPHARSAGQSDDDLG